ncbi:DNA polymerase III subunit beta [Aurantimonas sp. 22II-16-19i]|uniref:DNA polymerase III subunit beta n=1 Tax=Aurantimonas sp. 22II-16-19i TaxID=1317114 RepID=UPI0009F7C466|nr:DNA polymerase III subunit beta [Aurantimonas sp. 22II-16-19i]ORE90957.1 DNA polymerase III subunit beta [Aurantimonas sp. 22II-16-19i]
MTLSLTLPRAALLPLLARAIKVVEKRNTIPILDHLVLSVDREGAVSVTATDLDIWIAEALPAGTADVTAAGAIALKAGLLHDVLRKLPDGEVRIAADEDGGRVTVSAGRARFAVNALPAEDLPEARTVSAEPFRLDPSALAAIVETTAFAISTEETRYYLNGIYLHAVSAPHPEVPPQGPEPAEGPKHEGPGSPSATVQRTGETSGSPLEASELKDGADRLLVAVATDGHRLSRLALPAPAGMPAFKGAIVPKKTCGLLAMLCEVSGGQPIELAIDDNAIRLAAGAIVLTSKLIDGTFPDYTRVIPQAAPFAVTLDRAALTAAIDRVATVSTERGRAVAWTITPGELALTVTSSETGTADETMPAETDGNPATGPLATPPDGFRIGFNARYVTDLLATLDGPIVTVRLTDPGSPAVVTDPSDDRRTMVLMPMRV